MIECIWFAVRDFAFMRWSATDCGSLGDRFWYAIWTRL